MDESSWGTYLLPWWKPLIYLLVAFGGAATFKVSMTFNLNEYLKRRDEGKVQKERLKDVKGCMHIWNLYLRSEFSQCNLCMAVIKTALLLYAREHFDEKPTIIATSPSVQVNPEGTIQVSDYIGRRQS